MKPELMLLVWSVLLTFVQMLVAVGTASLQVGLPALVGNREGLPVLTGWAGRAQRAHRNMLESLVLFAVVVLVAAVTDKTNSITLLGAQLYFWARLGYAVVYFVGIPWVRTLVWLVSVIGIAMIILQLI
jgi:uncharacterized MAPEG superfamily protein